MVNNQNDMVICDRNIRFDTDILRILGFRKKIVGHLMYGGKIQDDTQLCKSKQLIDIILDRIEPDS